MAFDPSDPVSQKTKDMAEDDLWILLGVEWQFFYEWMCEKGKDPTTGKGLSDSVAANYVWRLDQIHRVIWQEFDQESLFITPHQASVFVDLLDSDELRTQSGDAYGGNSKRKFVNSIQKYSVWKARDGDEEWEEWEPQETFGQSSYDSSDILSLDEFGRLTEAAKRLNELPDYEEVSPEKRDEINARLAQRFHKPASRVAPEDWSHEENGAKIPSLVMTAQDVALPPIEIHRATIDWVDLDRGVLDIPDGKASKQRDSDDLSLSPPTQEQLAKWLNEREQYEKYADTDALWLNERGNRYTSDTLNYLLEKLCKEAGIDQDGRKITWYSIRRTAGTYLKEYDSLEMANDILRHEPLETTETHYSEKVREVQRASVSGVRELGQARASGELSEREVGQILSGDAKVLFTLFKQLNDDSESLSL